MRDLNEDMLKNPYDDELRQIVQQFGALLKQIVDTIDRHGLKKHFLNKHLCEVTRFYRWLVNLSTGSGKAKWPRSASSALRRIGTSSSPSLAMMACRGTTIMRNMR